MSYFFKIINLIRAKKIIKFPNFRRGFVWEFRNLHIHFGPDYISQRPFAFAIYWGRRDNPALGEIYFENSARLWLGLWRPVFETRAPYFLSAHYGSEGFCTYLPHEDGEFCAANWTGRQRELFRFNWPFGFEFWSTGEASERARQEIALFSKAKEGFVP